MATLAERMFSPIELAVKLAVGAVYRIMSSIKLRFYLKVISKQKVKP